MLHMAQHKIHHLFRIFLSPNLTYHHHFLYCLFSEFLFSLLFFQFLQLLFCFEFSLLLGLLFRELSIYGLLVHAIFDVPGFTLNPGQIRVHAHGRGVHVSDANSHLQVSW